MADVEVALEHSQAGDNYIFSYTSGTTGDAKGVKLNHRNVISVAQTIGSRFPPMDQLVVISYLPYPHSFEQCMLSYTLLVGGKIGYY
jgi:long-chain acyl-CoA synthetase